LTEQRRRFKDVDPPADGRLPYIFTHYAVDRVTARKNARWYRREGDDRYSEFWRSKAYGGGWPGGLAAATADVTELPGRAALAEAGWTLRP
jgi:hypothetical protein